MELLPVAINYLQKGLSIIPVGIDKKPLVKWQEFQNRLPTLEEIHKWFGTHENKKDSVAVPNFKPGEVSGIAIVTGKLSNLSVVDVDVHKGGKTDGLPPTLVSKTQSGGWHYYYRYLPGLPNKADIKPGVDIRSEGGYVIAPPSVGEKGVYEWVLEEDPQPFPVEQFQLEIEEAQLPNDWDAMLQGSQTGSRNQTAAKLAGLLFQKFDPPQWPNLVWQLLLGWNKQNKPPLPERELRAVFNSIAGREMRKRKGEVEDDVPVVLMSEAAKKFNDGLPMITYPSGFDTFDEVSKGGFAPGNLVILVGQTGMGKCLGKGTKVRMHDGSVKKVEEVKRGDLLMGADSTPRKVLGTNSGKDLLYKVSPVRGEPYYVNSSHILSTKYRNTYKKNGTKKPEQLVNLSVRDFLSLSPTKQRLHYGYRVPVEYPEKKLPIEPYFLGAWLGDGTSESSNVTNADPEVRNYLKAYAKKIGHQYREIKNNNTFRITITQPGTCQKSSFNLQRELNSLNLLKNKHIPNHYLHNSRKNRLQLLAGLIDTDGFLNKPTTYEIVQKSKHLAEQIAELACSLGFFARLTKKVATIKSLGFKGLYYRVSISGDTSVIPVKVKRKKATKRKQIKDILITTIQVEPTKVGEYYGFELDGDHLFLLEDFTVTHNSTLSRSFSANLLDQNIPSVWFTFEMTIPEMWEKFKEMGLKDKDHIYTPETYLNRKLPWLKKKIIEARDIHKCKAVFIDHLGFLVGEYDGGNVSNMSNNLATVYTMICRDLKTIAVQEEVVIVLMWHLKKMGFGKKEADLDDIKDSSGVAQEADFVFSVEREKASDQLSSVQDVYSNYSWIKMLKNRRTGGNKRFKCIFHNERLREVGVGEKISENIPEGHYNPEVFGQDF